MTLILSGTNGLSDVDGSAANPAIKGTDANTGIFFGADIIGFSEGGAEVARFNADSQFVAAAGTASLPVITTTGDVNTGIFFPAADTIAFAEGGAEVARFDSSGNLGIGTTTMNGKFNSTPKATYNASSTTWAEAALSTAGNYGGGLSMIDGTAGYGLNVEDSGGSLVIRQGTVGSSPTERMRINSSGNLLVGTTSSDISAVGIRLMNNNQLQASKGGDWSFRMGRRDSTGIITEIYYNSSRVGDIATNGSNTTYNSASDYRLKENVQPMVGALDKVAALKPVTFTWKATSTNDEGFLAHELQAVVPQAVRGEKDEVDADGKPVYQSIDTSVLVATLTAAIQEQQALITALTARITALEASNA